MGAVTQKTAFGLDVRSELPLLLLDRSTTRPTGRVLDISVEAGEVATLAWPNSSELVCDERQSDGSVAFRIWSHPAEGYLISGSGYGSHRLSVDGRRLVCLPEGNPDGAWQRLLIAQLLPFAALLQGLEVFHASAVARDGVAVGLLGPSRSGKTSLALGLRRLGWSFLADDVLAIEPQKEGLLAHPGTPVAGVDRADAEPSPVDENGELEQHVLAVNVRERLVNISGASGPTPLTCLLFLERRASGPERPRFEAVSDAQMLLSATFNFVLVTPERLNRLLDVCAIAARLRVERVVIGPGTGIPELSVAVEQRLNSRA